MLRTGKLQPKVLESQIAECEVETIKFLMGFILENSTSMAGVGIALSKIAKQLARQTDTQQLIQARDFMFKNLGPSSVEKQEKPPYDHQDEPTDEELREIESEAKKPFWDKFFKQDNSDDDFDSCG